MTRFISWTVLAVLALIATAGVYSQGGPMDLPPGQIAAIDQALADQAKADAVVEQGAYISDPAVLAKLDQTIDGVDCGRLGKLSFGCLIQQRDPNGRRPRGMGNPFNLDVGTTIRETIHNDLGDFMNRGGHIDRHFLTDPNSRLELVGVVNRMDRKFVPDNFNRDTGRQLSEEQNCGEISLIYRFVYSLNNGQASSRLPVTMNVVLPARPGNAPPSARPCQAIAQKWLAEFQRPRIRPADQYKADLLNPTTGVLAGIRGIDIDRIELNIQSFRRPTSDDANRGMGSTAEYVIRVFRWDKGKFVPSFLLNQIDRARLLGGWDGNSCVKQAPSVDLRAGLVKWLGQPGAIRDIDNGTLVIPIDYLACRAISHSPGGPARSGNQPFWQGKGPADTIVSDPELTAIIAAAETPPQMFRTAADMRMRMNELTCSGCHQTRAIAGFHFPGEDRPDTAPSNAVKLAGSPHFYGDLMRRVDFLRLLARGRSPKPTDYRSGYASRPLSIYAQRLAQSQLIGGWGAACLVDDMRVGSQRQWGCREDQGLECRQSFRSDNAPGLGTCMPHGVRQIGDPMQEGKVVSDGFGREAYERERPKAINDERDVLIAPDSVSPPPPAPPANNEYYAAHQEYYEGQISGGAATGKARAVIIRDAKTGGFPGGMLRLSECRGLPREATCGLIASNGFTDCVNKVRSGGSLAPCFALNTSYAGLRACSASQPCRDDYICLRPMGYTATDGQARFDARAQAVKGRDGYDPKVDFGQQPPGPAWLGRNKGLGDQRGVCIPPYFVFQFRSDGHPPAPLPSHDGHDE